MKVVFMGTPDFSVPTLQALIDAGYEVAGVFTQPDRPRGRGGKVQMSPVKELALRHGLSVFQPLRIRRDGLEPLRALAPDVCVTAAFGQILSQEVLDVPRLGTVNVHGPRAVGDFERRRGHGRDDDVHRPRHRHRRHAPERPNAHFARGYRRDADRAALADGRGAAP